MPAPRKNTTTEQSDHMFPVFGAWLMCWLIYQKMWLVDLSKTCENWEHHPIFEGMKIQHRIETTKHLWLGTHGSNSWVCPWSLRSCHCSVWVHLRLSEILRTWMFNAGYWGCNLWTWDLTWSSWRISEIGMEYPEKSETITWPSRKSMANYPLVI